MSKPDARYNISLEWCGFSTRRHVLRFCGDYIKDYKTAAAAKMGAISHNNKRMAQYVTN